MRKLLCFCLAVLMLAGLAACSNPDSSLPEVTPEPEVSSVPEPAPEPEEEPEPEPEGKASVLTGLEVAADYAAGKRMAAVVVGNYLRARPHSGLSGAGVLVEELVEGGITRFLAFYEDYAAMPEVGPVRSSRDSFLQLAMPWQPLYVCYGSSQMHDWYLETFQQSERVIDSFMYEDIVLRNNDKIDADDEVNTAYSSGELLSVAVADSGIDDMREYSSTFFDFVPYDEAPRALGGGAAEALTIPHSEKYVTYFDYDAADSRYRMSQSDADGGKQAATDANNGQQLGFSNVLVLFAEMPVYNGTDDLRNVQYGYGGLGYYFCGGTVEQVRWMKDSPEHALRILAADGSEAPVQLNPGTSYVAFVDVEQAAEVSWGMSGKEAKLG